MYLSLEEVGDCLVEDFFSQEPQDKRLDRFLDYLIDNCVDSNATFSPKILAEKMS